MTSDAPLVDVSAVSFEVLTDEDNGPVVQAMKRMVDSVSDSEGVLSAFQSFAGVDYVVPEGHISGFSSSLAKS